MNYFIADTHFFHQSLLGDNDFAPRPFESAAAMNAALVAAWNNRVRPQDVVYHLGDIAMNQKPRPSDQEVLALVTQLNGHIVWIKGNHDYTARFKYFAAHDPGGPAASKFSFHSVGTIIKDDHTQFIMSHYPMLLGITKQTLNLHGHIHHNMVPVAENINVGVDAPERQWLENKLPWGSPLTAREVHQLAQAKAQWLAAQKGQA